MPIQTCRRSCPLASIASSTRLMKTQAVQPSRYFFLNSMLPRCCLDLKWKKDFIAKDPLKMLLARYSFTERNFLGSS